jgi:hypothetical protein
VHTGQVVADDGDLVDDDLDGVRHLLERAAQDLLADELGQELLVALVRAVLGREEERALGDEPPRWARSSSTPSPLRALTGKMSSAIPSSAAALSTVISRARSSRSILLTAMTTGTGAPASRAAIQRSPGPTPSSPLRTMSAASAS